jgi:hypothetical protein
LSLITWLTVGCVELLSWLTVGCVDQSSIHPDVAFRTHPDVASELGCCNPSMDGRADLVSMQPQAAEFLLYCAQPTH